MTTEYYMSSKDSELLRSSLEGLVGGGIFLEIGFGYGSNLKEASSKFMFVVGTDIQSLESTRQAKRNLAGFANVELVRADKASCFREGVFDAVATNPPYLPTDTRVKDHTVDGGHEGVGVPIEFVESGLSTLKQEGKMVLLLSNEGNLEAFHIFCEKENLRCKVINRKDLFYETLFVYSLERC